MGNRERSQGLGEGIVYFLTSSISMSLYRELVRAKALGVALDVLFIAHYMEVSKRST